MSSRPSKAVSLEIKFSLSNADDVDEDVVPCFVVSLFDMFDIGVSLTFKLAFFIWVLPFKDAVFLNLKKLSSSSSSDLDEAALDVDTTDFDATCCSSGGVVLKVQEKKGLPHK